MREQLRLSIAVPVYNEEKTIPELLRRTCSVVDKLPGGPHEIVIVDDGSSDRTFDLLSRAAAGDARLRAISLSRNFGHQAAITAALDHVSGDVVVIMDGDLQDPPEAIPRLIEEYQKGFDVVYGQRVGRKENWLLRSCYYLFYRSLVLFSHIRMPLDAGDFALVSGRVLQELRRLPEHQRYLRGLRTWVGFRQIGVPVERAQRLAGASKYSFGKLFGLAFDGLFAFSVVPLRAATALGLLTTFLSLVFAAYSIYDKLFHQSPKGFTALVITVIFLSGVQLLFLGVIGEYLGRIYEESKGRPHYIIDRIARGRTPGLAVTSRQLERPNSDEYAVRTLLS